MPQPIFKVTDPYRHELGDVVSVKDDAWISLTPRREVGIILSISDSLQGSLLYTVHWPNDPNESEAWTWSELMPQDEVKHAMWSAEQEQQWNTITTGDDTIKILPIPVTPVPPNVWIYSTQSTGECAVEKFHRENPGAICMLSCNCSKCSARFVWDSASSYTWYSKSDSTQFDIANVYPSNDITFTTKLSDDISIVTTGATDGAKTQGY